ncbi:MAG: ATPase domain-containing protein [Candidatus ainarchaeum sp.]|nr:ATPase domain-containing protein [Candidatus ainarchaeum sp.]HPM86319.1 ATPase domain-containing protein [archaeon]
MVEENVFIPSNKVESGFSIKSGDDGVKLKKLGDSVSGEASEEYSERELDIQRVNDGGDNSRVKSGINGFDELIQGGFERESIVLVVGASGTGKTILSMQFLYNGAALYDEPGVFLSFEEDKNQLYRQANQFGWDFDKLEKENKFRLLTFKPHQITKILEEGGGQIRDALSEVKAKRIVVDSITAYGLLFRDEYKRREKILEFFNMLRKWGVTSLVICEDDPEVVEKEEGGIGFISDAVVSLYYDQDKEKGIRIHSLEILKMRGTKHTNKVCAINFEKDGVTVYPDVEIF